MGLGTKLVLQSVGADGIFQHGEAKGIGPDLVDGSACFGAEFEQQRGSEEAGLNAVDRVEALSQTDRGAIDADPVDAEDFDIQPAARAIKRRRVVRIGTVPDLAQGGFGRAIRAAQYTSDPHIIIELVIDLAVTDIAEDLSFDDRLVFCDGRCPYRSLRQGLAGPKLHIWAPVGTNKEQSFG